MLNQCMMLDYAQTQYYANLQMIQYAYKNIIVSREQITTKNL